jgi:hypothetical protein
MLPEPPTPGFQARHALQESVAGAEEALEVDFKAFYYQIPLDPRVRKFFTFCCGGRYYQMTRLPMGFKWAVVIAQAVSKHIMGMVRDAQTVRGQDVYIDNLFVCGNTKECRDAEEHLQRICRTMGVTIGGTERGRMVTHRGMVFDLERQHISLSEGFLVKFERRWRCNGGSWGEWRSLLGSIIYAMMVLRMSLGSIYYALKFWARHALEQPKTKIILWTKAKAQLEEARSKMATKVKMDVPRKIESFLFTDATPKQLGAVLVHKGRIWLWTEPLKQETKIAEAEAYAVAGATRFWNQYVNNIGLCVVMDNVAVLCALAKGFSSNFG